MKKSSRRVVIDSKLQKDMPFLEFNALYPRIHCQTIFQPHEMFWSSGEYVKEANMDWYNDQYAKRVSEKTA